MTETTETKLYKSLPSQKNRKLKPVRRVVIMNKNLLWNLPWWNLPRLLLENQTAYLLWLLAAMLIYPVVMMR